MKTKTLLLVTLPAALAFAVSGCESEKEEEIQWPNLPAVVQETITEHVGDGEIEEIEKEIKTENGKSVTVYEVEVKKSDGKEVEIKVGEDGKLIKIEDD